MGLVLIRHAELGPGIFKELSREFGMSKKETREIYEKLSEEFARKGVASDLFSLLEKLYLSASVAENLKDYSENAVVRAGQKLRIGELKSQLTTANKKIEMLRECLEIIRDMRGKNNSPTVEADLAKECLARESLEQFEEMEKGDA